MEEKRKEKKDFNKIINIKNKFIKRAKKIIFK